MKTLTFTVNAVGDPEAVTVQTVCRRITIGEDDSVAGWPTTDFKVRKPDKTDPPIQKAAGKTYVFEKQGDRSFWQPNEIAGYVELPSGSTTFFQDEE